MEHLSYDVTNVVHYLRPASRVIVVGTGGGRDVLSALAFDQKAVTGVEINEGILELVNGRFGDFTGHLDRDPRVRFVNDEARSYIARLNDRADIIQISLIDTWAATASGAFVLDRELALHGRRLADLSGSPGAATASCPSRGGTTRTGRAKSTGWRRSPRRR